MSGSRRRIAKAACLTEWEVRVALDQLIQCGWIERRQIADHVSVHYRLTPAFAEALELAGEEVSGIVSQYVRRGNAPIEPPARAPISPDLAEHLRAYAWQHLMQRLLTLNERPKRYARGYSKPVLRGTAITLHWFIQAALQQQGEPRVVSLRGLAQETGLTFRSAKQARARLIAWGLLAEQNGAWLLDYTRLAHLLFEEGAELLSAPAVDRRRGSHHDH